MALYNPPTTRAQLGVISEPTPPEEILRRLDLLKMTEPRQAILDAQANLAAVTQKKAETMASLDQMRPGPDYDTQVREITALWQVQESQQRQAAADLEEAVKAAERQIFENANQLNGAHRDRLTELDAEILDNLAEVIRLMHKRGDEVRAMRQTKTMLADAAHAAGKEAPPMPYTMPWYNGNWHDSDFRQNVREYLGRFIAMITSGSEPGADVLGWFARSRW